MTSHSSSEIVWIDIETSGLDKHKHQIVQVAMIATDMNLAEIEADEFKMRFSVNLASTEALSIIGYSPERWRDAIGQRDGVVRMADFFARHATWRKSGSQHTFAMIGGHNVALFDAPFLAEYFRRANTMSHATLWTGGQFDTLQMAKTYFFVLGLTNESLKLESLCRRFGIELGNAHDALADVRATIRLAAELKKQFMAPDSVIEVAMQLGGVIA